MFITLCKVFYLQTCPSGKRSTENVQSDVVDWIFQTLD